MALERLRWQSLPDDMQHEILARSSTTAEVEVVSSQSVCLAGKYGRHNLVGTTYRFTRVFTETGGLYAPSLEVDITRDLARGFAATAAWQNSTLEEREQCAVYFGRQLHVKRVSAVRFGNHHNRAGDVNGMVLNIAYTDDNGRERVEEWMPELKELFFRRPQTIDNPAVVEELQKALALVGAESGSDHLFMKKRDRMPLRLPSCAGI
jgi:hypothetical protein